MIKLIEITNKNIWKVCALEPFDEQKDFVAENIQSLAEAYATRNEGNNALPLAVTCCIEACTGRSSCSESNRAKPVPNRSGGHRAAPP